MFFVFLQYTRYQVVMSWVTPDGGGKSVRLRGCLVPVYEEMDFHALFFCYYFSRSMAQQSVFIAPKACQLAKAL